MENPPFWWYLPGKMGIFMGYISFREGTPIVGNTHLTFEFDPNKDVCFYPIAPTQGSSAWTIYFATGCSAWASRIYGRIGWWIISPTDLWVHQVAVLLTRKLAPIRGSGNRESSGPTFQGWHIQVSDVVFLNFPDLRCQMIGKCPKETARRPHTQQVKKRTGRRLCKADAGRTIYV